MENHEEKPYNNNNNNNNNNKNKSPKNPDPTPSPSSPDLSPLSHDEIEINNSIITNNPPNSTKTTSLATSAARSPSSTSSELSPLSSPGHPQPSDSPLCHVSPSQNPSAITNKPSETKTASATSASPELSPLDSPLCHVSPSPAPAPKRVRQSLSILRAVKREKAVKRAALGFRFFGFCFCLVSLAVMAADKDKGWALDSFYRYKEFRYCISVNVVGFLYSVAQTCDLAFTLCTGKYVLRHQYRVYFDFAMDQILTYLLMSASSSAATRVDDWESNWGKDEFPMMASISVGLSFMSFVALAASTLISGYALCTWSSP